MGAADSARVAEPLDERVDHVRGEAGAPVILEYGDYECPYSRQAFRAIERVERELAGRVRFAFLQATAAYEFGRPAFAGVPAATAGSARRPPET